MWRTRLKHVLPQTFWLVKGKFWLEERVLQKWSNAVLSQLPALPGDLSSVPSLTSTSWRRAQRAGCTCVTKQHKKSTLHRRLHQVNCKSKRITPPCFLFSPLSFSLFTPALDYPCGRTNMASADWWYSVLSLSAFISLLPHSAWAQHGYPVLLHTWSWSLPWEWGACGGVLWLVSQHLWESPCDELRADRSALSKSKGSFISTCENLLYKFKGLLANNFSV